MCSLNRRLDTIGGQYELIHTDIYQKDGITKTLSKLELGVESVPTVRDETTALRHEVDILKAVVMKQDFEIKQLKNKTTDLQA